MIWSPIWKTSAAFPDCTILLISCMVVTFSRLLPTSMPFKMFRVWSFSAMSFHVSSVIIGLVTLLISLFLLISYTQFSVNYGKFKISDHLDDGCIVP